MKEAIQHRLHRLGSQLTLIFLVGFLGIGIAIGLPVILLISQQSSSHAQLLLDQAVVASRAFLEREEADLQSLALLISQRPTLTRLLNEEDFSALESYLETLREGGNVDLILVCLGDREVTELHTDQAELCRLDSQSGYQALASGSAMYLYATADIASDGQPLQHVLIGKHVSSILRDLQKETGLLYFLLWQDQAVYASDPALEVNPALAAGLLQSSNRTPNRSLEQRSFRINEHRYILSNQE